MRLRPPDVVKQSWLDNRAAEDFLGRFFVLDSETSQNEISRLPPLLPCSAIPMAGSITHARRPLFWELFGVFWGIKKEGNGVRRPNKY